MDTQLWKTKKNEKGLTLEEFLAEYDADRYRHPSCTVDMAVMTVAEKKLKLLLVSRRDHPFIGCWATPGGFVGFDEDLDAAALRELKEETGLSEGIYFKQMYTFGKANRDPRTRIITTAYLTLASADLIAQAKAGDDAADAKWFDITKEIEYEDDTKRVAILTLFNSELNETMKYRIITKVMGNWAKTTSEFIEDESTNMLAGDHIKIVNMAVEEVRHRAASTGIIFNLLPSEFSLNELRKTYEIVTGTKIDRNNFRRNIKGLVKPTGNSTIYWGKETALYTANPLYEHLDF